ncbi:hypothetical protein BGW41_007675 [Actinomortierella wolfii]|nr:hypothetical protein BGW41_007675 [Actinomortierella wolfii]
MFTELFAKAQEKVDQFFHDPNFNPFHKGNEDQPVTHSVAGVTSPPDHWSQNRNMDFEIIFHGAKELARADLLSSDPFLEAYLGPPTDQTSLSFVTGVEWATLNPNWEANWTLLNVTEGMQLQLYVKDKNKMMEDTPLGTASLILGANLSGEVHHELDVWKSDNKKQGKLYITTVGTPCTPATAALTKPSTRGPCRFSRHTSYAAGVLTQESKYEFYTYRLRLYHLFDIFGTDPRFYQHWNTKYEAAQRIFGDNLEGLNIRNALHSQHSYLYRHGKNTIYNALATAEDIGNLLHGNRDPSLDLQTVVFTYSIVPKGMYFSETGTAFFQDFMSKHAMHANRATEVMYSGEFRLYRDAQYSNAWTLLIDNNSGTYAPRKEDLPKVKELFERNFPDLRVVVMDHEDPYLKEIRERTKRVEAQIAAERREKLTLFNTNEMRQS